jgi:alpha-tubulin suppressor-like RCC1 family protein
LATSASGRYHLVVVEEDGAVYPCGECDDFWASATRLSRGG